MLLMIQVVLGVEYAVQFIIMQGPMISLCEIMVGERNLRVLIIGM